MARQSQTSKRAIEAREHEAQATAYRRQGMSYAAIGERLGLTEMGAYKAVRRVLDRLNKQAGDDKDAERRLDLERCDALLAGLWPEATAGGIKATETALAVLKRRADLLGLDAPARTDHKVSGDPNAPISVVYVNDWRGGGE